VICRALPAFDLNPTSVAFNKLHCDEQTDACAHGAASGEEGFKYPWQISLCDSEIRRRVHDAPKLFLPGTYGDFWPHNAIDREHPSLHRNHMVQVAPRFSEALTKGYRVQVQRHEGLGSSPSSS
jgi:hypothetical protein